MASTPRRCRRVQAYDEQRSPLRTLPPLQVAVPLIFHDEGAENDKFVVPSLFTVVSFGPVERSGAAAHRLLYGETSLDDIITARRSTIQKATDVAKQKGIRGHASRSAPFTMEDLIKDSCTMFGAVSFSPHSAPEGHIRFRTM